MPLFQSFGTLYWITLHWATPNAYVLSSFRASNVRKSYISWPHYIINKPHLLLISGIEVKSSSYIDKITPKLRGDYGYQINILILIQKNQIIYTNVCVGKASKKTNKIKIITTFKFQIRF